jgi:hypothetical protein
MTRVNCISNLVRNRAGGFTSAAKLPYWMFAISPSGE